MWFTALIASLFLAGQQEPALKIVVLEGEGGVNIIQQKTAVRPLVEVRDRNNLPVPGATVTFTIGGGGQSAVFAGGAQTLTVTTNAAGQAAVSSLNAVSSGAFQIQVQAAYQGQLATAAISQTNFATAAAAAQAGAGAGAGAGGGAGGGTASGAAGGAAGGGGISGTTIGLGVAGAAVAGGAIAATQVLGGESSDGSGSGGENVDGYEGPLSGQLTLIQGACTRTHTVSGTLRIELIGGNATGKAGSPQVTLTETSVTGTCIPATQPITFSIRTEDAPVSGGPTSLTFRHVSTFVNGTTYTVTFTGSLSGNTITGTINLDVATPPGANPPVQSGSTSFPVTLTKQ
jgi:hypothetical protein